MLQVLDEGAGIPPEDLERIFDKFYRVRKGDTQRAGTGLGLAICRGFVEAMGGTIVAANRRDRTGAVFTITLPVPAVEKPEAPSQAAGAGRMTAPHVRVLVVDDEPPIRRLLRTSLVRARATTSRRPERPRRADPRSRAPRPT